MVLATGLDLDQIKRIQDTEPHVYAEMVRLVSERGVERDRLLNLV